MDAWAEEEEVAVAAVGDTSEAEGKAAGVDAAVAVTDAVEVSVGDSRLEAAPISRADWRGEPGADGGADEGADDGADGAREPATVEPDTDGRNFWR